MGAGVTEEEIRASVDKSFDMLAPGGGFAWCGGCRGPVDDQVIIRKIEILKSMSMRSATAIIRIRIKSNILGETHEYIDSRRVSGLG